MTVALPVHNGERFLGEAIRSLLAQTLEDFRLVVFDNASTDATPEICRAFAAEDARVRYVRRGENVGLVANWNGAFEGVATPYFKWAAHDDVCGPDLLARCVSALEDDPAASLAHPRVRAIDEVGMVLDREQPDVAVDADDPASRFATLMRNSFWTTPLFGVIRTAALKSTGLHGRSVAGDHVLLTELALRGRFCRVDEVAFFHRQHADKGAHQASVRDRARYLGVTGAPSRFVRLRMVEDYITAVRRAQLSPSDRARCYCSIASWIGRRGPRRLFPWRRGPGPVGQQVSGIATVPPDS